MDGLELKCQSAPFAAWVVLPMGAIVVGNHWGLFGFLWLYIKP